ncbi:uncharacterized protein DS421_11g343750 [Arachis hypogaea]|nr:uncharacterized protein DS421_11g343750 [Arachis hypogaea]
MLIWLVEMEIAIVAVTVAVVVAEAERGGLGFLMNHSLGRQSRMDEFFEHTHTRKEDRTQWVDEHSQKTKDIFQERMFQAEQERQAAIEAGVINPPPVSEESIWIETMDQFSHQLSSLTEYVRAMGLSSSGSCVPPPPPFTFPSSQKSTAPAPGRKLPPILQRPGQPQSSQREDDSDDFDDSDDYLDEYE